MAKLIKTEVFAGRGSNQDDWERLKRIWRMLRREEQKRIVLLAILQSSLGVIDLFGIALAGMLSILFVTGIKSQAPVGLTKDLLELFSLDSLSLSAQTAIIGSMAGSFLIGKSILSMHVTRRNIQILSEYSSKYSGLLYEELLMLDFAYLRRSSKIANIHAVTSSVEAIFIGVIGKIVILTSDFILFALISVSLIVFDFLLFITLFITVGGGLLFIHKRTNHRNRLLMREGIHGSIQNVSKSLEDLEMFRELYVRRLIKQSVENFQVTRGRLWMIQAEQTWIPYIGKYYIEIIVTLSFLMMSAVQFLQKDAAGAVLSLSVYATSITRLAPALLRIQQNVSNLHAQIEGAVPALEIMGRSDSRALGLPQKGISIAPKAKEDFKPFVEINNLTFRFSDSTKNVFSDFSFRVKEGEFVAVVGESGIGKSTLFDILLGLLEPTEGEVTISGLKPKAAIDLWPGSIGYVPQVPVIRSGTIWQNIVLSDAFSPADEPRVWQVLEFAQLDDFVRSLPYGIHTTVDQGGSNLSGGQRQRLTIARAMFSNPKLVLFDEVTSSLDSETIKAFSQAIEKLKGTSTLIVISHDPRAVKGADRTIWI